MFITELTKEYIKNKFLKMQLKKLREVLRKQDELIKVLEKRANDNQDKNISR